MCPGRAEGEDVPGTDQRPSASIILQEDFTVSIIPQDDFTDQHPSVSIIPQEDFKDKRDFFWSIYSPFWSNHMLMVQPANCPLQLPHLREPSVFQHNPTVTMIEVSVHRKPPKKQTPGRHLPQGQVSAPRTRSRC